MKTGEKEAHCSFTVTLHCSNPSNSDVEMYHGVIDFKRGADYITDVTIVREEGLKAGESTTITATFTDDEPNQGWKTVADSNLNDLRIRWKPWKIRMPDGTLLVGTME